MDKIDSFIIHANQKEGSIEFNFVVVEEDVKEKHRSDIVGYIDRLLRILNRFIPQFIFTWEEAHRAKPERICEEIIHQILVQK